MAGDMRPDAPVLPVPAFRSWLASRPDEDRWEWIAGVPTVTPPPSGRHQRIASNLETLPLFDPIADS